MNLCGEQSCSVRYITKKQVGYKLKTDVYINQLKVTNQTVYLVREQSTKRITNMIGYSPKSDFITNVFSQNEKMQKVVAIYFGDHKYNFDSQVVIGGFNHKVIRKGCSINYHQNYGSDNWKVNVTQIKLNSRFVFSDNMYSVFDSRQFGITFPWKLYRRIRQLLEKYYLMKNCGAQYFLEYYRKEAKIGCLIYYNKPQKYRKVNLMFTVEDKNYILKYNQIVYKCVMKLIYKVCLLNINYQIGLSYVKLGQIFLKNYYLVLDYENNKVGLVRSEKGKIVFMEQKVWKNKMVCTVSLWAILFMMFGVCNVKDIQHYNKVIYKLVSYLYQRLVGGSEEQLIFSETSISYQYYDQFMQYLDRDRNNNNNGSEMVDVSGYVR